jgi:hypothetical protein
MLQVISMNKFNAMGGTRARNGGNKVLAVIGR